MDPTQAEIEVFERVMTGYYKKPEAAEAAQALSILLRYTDKWREPPGNAMMLFFFYRAAQTTPNAQEAYHAIRPALNEEQNLYIEKLLGALSARNAPNPLGQIAQTPTELDWCWVEFLVTGSPEPVKHIAKSLYLPDVIREQLETWYAENSRRTGALRFLQNVFGDKVSGALRTLSSVGIEFAPETKKVTREEDMDFYCFGLAEQRIQIFKILPFQLTPEQLGVCGAKSAALWSLRNNAQHHTVVASCCQEEAQKPGNKLSQKLLTPLNDSKPYFP